MREALKRLQDEWDEKLKESGFIDIEQRNGYLKDFDSVRFQKRNSPEKFLEKKQYFELASHLLEDHPFLTFTLTDVEIEIWDLHCQGYGAHKAIPQILSSRGRFMNKDYVNKIIQEIDSILLTLMD